MVIWFDYIEFSILISPTNRRSRHCRQAVSNILPFFSVIGFIPYNKHCEGSCELLRWTVWNRFTVYNHNHVNHKNHLKFIFTFPDKILLIIFIFELSEIFIWQTDCKSNLWLYKCTQGTETGFTTLDTVQVYRINIIKS